MGAIEHLTISLPVELPDRIRDKLAAEDLADVNAAVVEALLEWSEPGSALDEDEWARREVLPALARYDADPSRGMSLDEVEAYLVQRRTERERTRC